MNKQDKLISQMEAVLAELKAGKEESAASLAFNQENNLNRYSEFRVNQFKWSIKKLLFYSILLATLLSGSFWYFSGSDGKAESTVFVEQVHGLATLATAEAHLKVVIEQEDNKLFGGDIGVNLPGTKRELLLIVPATVIAGVDLRNLSSDDFNVDESKKELEIVLPAAALIQEPAIKMDQIRAFSDEGLLRGKTAWDEGFDLAAAAQQQIEQEALEIGILQKAEENAEKVLKEFFGQMGYTVQVTSR